MAGIWKQKFVWAAIAVFLCVSGEQSRAQFPPAPGTGPGLAETVEAIDQARVTTRILYVTAHPDDESAAVLTYLARGLHADVALLSLTRGEGGQNVLGPEQAPQLGLIRTEELLAATRGYGVKLYFTSAKDFGFSKTPEETETVWGDQVLQDMVRVIREFRPNIVINNWGGVHSGHGHHQAAGLLTPKAVQLAAEPKYFLCVDCPELVSKAYGPVPVLDLERGSENPKGFRLPMEEISPLWGKAWREIGIDAFVNHRTQGMSAVVDSPFLRRPVALRREDGKEIDPSLFAQPLTAMAQEISDGGCGAVPTVTAKLKSSDDALAAARAQALQLHWKESAELVAKAALEFNSAATNGTGSRCGEPALWADIEAVQRNLIRATRLTAGLQMEANANRSELAVGNTFEVRIRSRCRPEVECRIGLPVLDLPQGMKQVSRSKDAGGVETITVAVDTAPPGRWTSLEVGSDPLVTLDTRVDVAGFAFNLLEPVTHTAASTTSANKLPLRIVPAYSLAVEPKQVIETLSEQHKPFPVFLRVHSYSTNPAKISAGLDVPAGWTSTAPVELAFEGEGDKYAKLTVTPPQTIAAGNSRISAYVKRGEEKYTTSLEPLVTMPTLLWEEPAQVAVHAFAVNVPKNLHVGYVSAENEPVPQALRDLGISVDMLDANSINFGDLSRYDAIVLGIRAYELRTELAGANQRLLDYVTSGGTLLVQYERDFAWDGKNYAPYPAKINPSKPGEPLPRITDENSPVKFLKPDDPLLNVPNKITPADFQGWVQERGLYFWTEYDSHYTPLLAMNDPGEKELNGALVYTRLGKGFYIYTGIAFFRQLPEGVPGAYRLFVNLLDASRSH